MHTSSWWFGLVVLSGAAVAPSRSWAAITCGADGDCPGADPHCVDNYCCNSACQGACAGCNGGDLGWTGAVNGTCAIAPLGSSGRGGACSPVVCAGASDCNSNHCADDRFCAQPFYCDSVTETCVAKKANGTPCAAVCQHGTDCSFCASGQCVDGVCCESPCDGNCHACKAELTVSLPDGQCGPVAKGQKRNDGCFAMRPGDCGATGYCDGNGACALYDPGTPCAASTCAANTEWTFVCDGAGACQPKPITCDVGCNNAGHCFAARAATSCSTDDPCRQGYRCAMHGDVGSCLDRCDSMSDCAQDETGSGYVCTRDHVCAPFSLNEGDASGRGCALARRSAAHDAGATGGLLFALAWIARGRRAMRARAARMRSHGP
jgi:hypothetical protein